MAHGLSPSAAQDEQQVHRLVAAQDEQQEQQRAGLSRDTGMVMRFIHLDCFASAAARESFFNS
jgi:hypothetical protein